MARFTPDRITGPSSESSPSGPDPVASWPAPSDPDPVGTLLNGLREQGRREEEGKELARLNTAQEIEERAERARERAQAAEDRKAAAQDRERATADRAAATRRFRATLLVSTLSAAMTAAGLVVTLTRAAEPAPPPPPGAQVEQVAPPSP